MPTIAANDLRDLTRSILLAAGADDRNASRVAEALVSSNLCGVDTHGVFHLPRYVREIREGLVVPTAWPEVLTESPTTALVSGNWTRPCGRQVRGGRRHRQGARPERGDGQPGQGAAHRRLGEYAEWRWRTA